MVYCGKPSRGCQMCRTRRIKCDETKPTCNQCAKSRRQCPGYKDEFDVVFRNETKATERRAIKANQKALANARKPEKLNDSSDIQVLLSSQASGHHEVIVMPQIPLDQQASCHFVSNFVLVPRQTWSRGYMEFLPALLKSNPGSLHFKYAFEACSLASLGNRSGPGQTFSEQAIGLYTKALAATHAALRDPVMATHDTTLAAVLLMGLYENMTARQLGTLSWGSHVEGAIEIAKARGQKQMRTKLGRQLFVAVRSSVIIHTISTGTAPAMGAEWWSTESVANSHAAVCQKLNLRTGELRAEITRLLSSLTRTSDNIELILDLIRRCQTVDQDLVQWMDNLPDEFQFKTVAWEDHVPNGDFSKAEVYPGRVDAYQDLWIASIWNMGRCARIILMSLIVRCAAWVCSPVDYRTTPEYATAARIVAKMITDIVASVPFQLGWFINRPYLLERANIASSACGDESSLKGVLGYWLTWPLCVINNQDYTTDSQRAWAQGRLHFIGNYVGVKYASMLAELKLRIPSMLIRKDGMMAQPYPGAANFINILSGKTDPSNNDYKQSPILSQANTAKASEMQPMASGQNNTTNKVPLLAKSPDSSMTKT